MNGRMRKRQPRKTLNRYTKAARRLFSQNPQIAEAVRIALENGADEVTVEFETTGTGEAPEA